MKKIVLITTGQPSVNPRLVKEADALTEAGFKVVVLYSFWIHWAYEKDTELLQSKKWDYKLVGGSPFNNKLLYFYTKCRQKISLFLSRCILVSGLPERFMARSFAELLIEAKKARADLYIGHTLGALSVAVLAAKSCKAKAGFDAEDFHRQEVSDDLTSLHYKSCKYLEDKYIPLLDYFTAASPLISETYQHLYPNLNPLVINNVFSIKYQPHLIPNISDTLKLFWFSQTIGKNRGIEDVIKALNILKNDKIELILLGNYNEETKSYFLNLSECKNTKIIFLPPVAPDAIFDIAAHYDIGLALEQNTPLNRDICLTNKIFTYLLSGLPIIASDTNAQKKMLEENPGVGKIFTHGNVEGLAKIIQYFFENRQILETYKANAHSLAANKYNFELESIYLINSIKNTFYLKI